jgi:3',5'-cyclic-AMP phosphodiesterase
VGRKSDFGVRLLLIAQISDCHVTAPGQLAYGRIDSADRLRRVVRTIGDLEIPPDLVIGTGDLVQGGTKAEYAALRDLLAELTVPFFPVLGNHDIRTGFRTAFPALADSIERFGFIEYVIDRGDLRILVLDTVRSGSGRPAFCAERLAWLKRQLDSSPNPVLIAMHYPPCPCGIAWLDAAISEWSSELGVLLVASGRVRGIICGHTHRAIYRLWHGIPVSAAPATALQASLNLSPTAQPRFNLEPPAFQLHRWDRETITTYTIIADGFDRRIPT